ncbi:MAG TPA: phytoene desaturase family protein [Fimbriimonadaceae bacterium]|nr:phytoene desaturase family protein [Fimbriimonadaceae bacterium]HRJ32123.1 phytoene desaturase family protein [Fimbriimonadaceae bacterium]
MARRHFVVIGGGLGGLATALRLSHRGHQVTLLEKTDQIGGRNRRQTLAGCEFDGGPTLMMMLDPFRKLFADVGERLEDHLTLTLCDPSYRVFYRDGARLEGTPNIARMLEQIQKLSGPDEAARYPGLIGELAELYHASIPHFVRKNYRSLWDFASPAQLKRVVQHRMLSNLGRRIDQRFSDPRLRMLFSFQTMYLGLSPYDAPWVYATLTYMEYGEGIWYPQGGMPAICEAVARLAQARGTEIRLSSPVARMEARSVTLESGETLTADAVICNADLPYAQEKLAVRPKQGRERRHSCSALVFYWPYEGSLPELLHHNIFFGRDFRGNLQAIFKDLQLPEDPAFYACVSSQTDSELTPPGWSNLYVLVPCPNLDRPFTDSDLESLRSQVFARLAEETSFQPDRVRGEALRTPRTWQSELNLNKGAAFGLSHDTFQSAFMRPPNIREGIYYVGASTVPGNGLPMVLISAELAEDRLERDGYL